MYGHNIITFVIDITNIVDFGESRFMYSCLLCVV